MQTEKTKHDHSCAPVERRIKGDTSLCTQKIVDGIARNGAAVKTVCNAFLEIHGPFNHLLQAYSDITLTQYVARRTFWLLKREDDGLRRRDCSGPEPLLDWEIEK